MRRNEFKLDRKEFKQVVIQFKLHTRYSDKLKRFYILGDNISNVARNIFKMISLNSEFTVQCNYSKNKL